MKKKIINACFILFVTLFINVAGAQAQGMNDSLVNVAFGEVAREHLLGGVATLNRAELMKKNYSINSLDGLESFIAGYNGNIWGQAGLVLVDGVPRSSSDILSSEIETVTVLKGAHAVALYGSKAAKGVVLITLKRGEEKPLSMDFRANTGIYVPKAYPKYLPAAEYMHLYNEAAQNDGRSAIYSPESIYHTAVGTNPYRYPDTDFYNSENLRNVFNRTDFTGELSGGDKRARYYTNIGMIYNNDLVKLGDQKNNNDMRFNVRGNLDVDLNDWLSSSVSGGILVYDSYRGRGDFWGNAATLRPNLYSVFLPASMLDPYNATLQATAENSRNLIEGKYLLGGTSSELTNTFGDALVAGYIKHKNRTFLFDVKLGADLGMIVEGLTFKTVFSQDYRNYYNEAYRLDYAVYQPTWSNMNGTDVIIGLQKFNNDTNSSSEYIGEANYSQTMSFSGQFDYNTTFGQSHNLSTTLMGWGYQIRFSADEDHEGGTYHDESNLNFGLQTTYNFRHKYYLDFTGALVHSAKLPAANRTAFSPTVTIGWRISNEDFFKNNVNFVDDLKLTATYANLHQDIDIVYNDVEYYLYQGNYPANAGWYQWRDGIAGGNTTGSARADNPTLTFIQRQEYRLGLETSLFNRSITLDANYFVQNTNGLLARGENTIYPSYFNRYDNSYLPILNFNEDKRTGVDFTVNLNKRISQVDLNLGFSGMIFASEAVRRDEVYEDDYQYRAAKPIDAYWGLISEGLFKDQQEIDDHVLQETWGVPKPGDIKYKDVNGDGKIDHKDEVNLGHNGWAASPFSFGVHFTTKWKNLTLFAMGTGINGAIGFKNSSYYWVRGNGKYSEVVLNRWTEETSDVATYPRLTTTDGSNNFRNSTFWMYKNNRFDLTRVQVTYDFPSAVFQNSFVDNLSIYVSGENLLTLSREREMMEMNIGSAPQYRFFNLGLKASF